MALNDEPVLRQRTLSAPTPCGNVESPLVVRDAMLTIGVILGSTRPGRLGEQVARWVVEVASERSDFEFTLLDLAAFDLPLLDEPLPPVRGQYQHNHTKRWSASVSAVDGFVMITPENNHSTSGALKNALDYLYREWNDKAVGFVSYGGTGGTRAVEHLRLIAAELKLADIRGQVALMLGSDFEEYRRSSRTSVLGDRWTPCSARSSPGQPHSLASAQPRRADARPPRPDRKRVVTSAKRDSRRRGQRVGAVVPCPQTPVTGLGAHVGARRADPGSSIDAAVAAVAFGRSPSDRT